MSPFSICLYDTRIRAGLTQEEFAQLVGCDQQYVSRLETGSKGPPTIAFVDRLCERLNLSDQERHELLQALRASTRKLVIDSDTPPEVFWMLAALRDRLPNLHPAQVRMIREIVELPDQLTKRTPEPITRLKRRRNTEARM